MGGWWTWLNGLLYGVGGLACASVAMLVAFQEKLVYVPVIPGMKRGYPIDPSRLHLRYEDVWLTAKDGVRLHSWYIEARANCSGPTILFFQENAGNIAHRLQFVELMVRRLQCNVFMLSYRGYGDSEGFPSQHGLKLDAQASLDYLHARQSVDSSRIVVFGRSLGGAVGSALVRDNPGRVAGLILENTFTSVLDMAGVMLPGLRFIVGGKGGLLNWFVKSPWKTIELIKHIEAPILFLAGQLDEMVPPAHMHQLLQQLRRLLVLSIHLLSFQMVCIWIHGCRVGSATGEVLRFFCKITQQLADPFLKEVIERSHSIHLPLWPTSSHSSVR